MNILSQFNETILTILNYKIIGLSYLEIILLFFLFSLAILFRGLFARIIVLKIKRLVTKTYNDIDDKLFDLLFPPIKFLPIVIIFFIFSFYINPNSSIFIYFQKINNSLLSVFVFWMLHQSTFLLSLFIKKLDSFLSQELTIWLTRSLKYLVIFLAIVSVLEVWGIKIGPIIAGLGLFGVAVALGAQDLFKNLISGVMLLLERRFKIGEIISIPNHIEGTVEHIGFRSTIIRKFDTTPVSIPNHLFAETPIVNFSKRKYRRINWIVGIEYRSSIPQIKEAIKSLETYIKNNQSFIVDDNYNMHIRLDKFNDSSIDILIYCYTNTVIWSEFLNIKEELAHKIKSIFEENKISFAFPSHSIYIEKN